MKGKDGCHEQQTARLECHHKITKHVRVSAQLNKQTIKEKKKQEQQKQIVFSSVLQKGY